MRREMHLIVLGATVCAATWSLVSHHLTGRARSPESVTVQAAQQSDDTSAREREVQRQFDAMDRDMRKQADELARRDADRRKREIAAAKTKLFRSEFQASRSAAWSQVILTNRAVYTELRNEAVHSESGTAPCTICNGRGEMSFCVLCKNNGKCPTCKGSGQYSMSELCPTCMGTGKCYMCGGTGRMVCPFCDDGIIEAKGPLPPELMPVN